jgi:ribonuclease R
LNSGDWALVTLPGIRRRYPLPSCRIMSVLGAPTEKGVAEQGLLASYGLNENYPTGAVREAAGLKVEPSRRGVREDLRREFVVTIDPADAKDHDDAVSLRRDSKGNYLLGVHIADVSRYVPEGSKIDEEAKKRGFSVYLQHHHLPMLPPKLPGEVCSLKTGKDRLALSILLSLDKDGKILSRRVIPSRVRIRRLISYETAQQYLDKDKSGVEADKRDPELQGQLRQMWRLAKVLLKRRLAEGGVDFDLPEPGFRWAEHAAPQEIFRQPRLPSHQLIEEFMLAANRAVADIWAEKLGDDMPQLFRVHPPPDAEKRQKLSDYLADTGFEWPADELTTAKQITALLDEARRRFPAEVVSVIARKALMLARYDTRARGHFGLGFKRYLHFTSPIRRYADLTVHRLIWKYLIDDHKVDSKGALREKLDQLCDVISERERLIAEVEREAGKLAGLLYLREHQDEAFPARFVEAAREKFYISLENLFIEGALDEGSGISFRPRRKKPSHSAKKGGNGSRLAIGDTLTVTPSRIDLLNRSLEFKPV